jgi:F-type H+-transporting ATPase subunit b
MFRRLLTAIALGCLPSAAVADTMPQMDFHNPLTADQLIWMAVILVVLYLLLAGWGLPRIGVVMENRASVIAKDLNAARVAKIAADQSVAALNATMKAARANAHAEIAAAVAQAKAAAALEAATVSTMLDAQLAASEAEIAAALVTAMAAIKPVAAETAKTILLRLTGQTPDAAALETRIGTAYAARAYPAGEAA